MIDSAPGHVAQVRCLVFDPLTTAQRRRLGTALSRVAETVRREIAGPAHIPPVTMADPTGRAPGRGNMIMTTRG
ncbi:hypothetical protein [Nocardia vulneris]|uniref:Uncharacterized protein n=1 Tax=Nocardia vulneris TaxID=1141657 RepID=A0ABR4ZHR2_9NOCA|nr:hypothetical protein [Nocardia vulneris]KIA64932.1 hypothetical protein FG87_10125 [Nocardia vulneris]